MIKIKKKNPYRKSGISSDDAYKLGETLELIYQLENLSRNSSKNSTLSYNRSLNCSRYMHKIMLQFPHSIKNAFEKGRNSGQKQAFELSDVLNNKQLKNYQESLLEEVEVLKYKNNL